MKQIDIERRIAPSILKDYFIEMNAQDIKQLNKWMRTNAKYIKEKYGSRERKVGFECVEISDIIYDHIKAKKYSKFALETAIDIYPEVKRLYYNTHKWSQRGDPEHTMAVFNKALKYANKLKEILDIRDDEILIE